jgi:hypothetical protein
MKNCYSAGELLMHLWMMVIMVLMMMVMTVVTDHGQDDGDWQQ